MSAASLCKSLSVMEVPTNENLEFKYISAAYQVEETWEDISKDLGWTPQDCLDHKLVFKKKEDFKVTKETLLQHVKRLRALGRHLTAVTEK